VEGGSVVVEGRSKIMGVGAVACGAGEAGKTSRSSSKESSGSTESRMENIGV
jgi:hypothetical protein